MTDNSQVQTSPQTEVNIESVRANVGDCHMHYRKAGNGPPVLLLHGGANESSDWIETMVAFSKDYTLYAPDLAGYGLSDRKEDGYSLSDFTESILGLIRVLDLGTSVMVGHSLGGRVCLEIALHHPEMVRKLVLIDSTGFSRLTRLGGFLGMAAYGVRKALGRPQPYPRILMANGTYGHWMCLERLPELRVSTLMVWSRIDPYYPLAGAVRASELIPQVKLEVFPGYGHAPHRAETDCFHGVLREFLSQD
jgi:pimeloyl-ACP methyl ester carboxylesterase